MSYIDGFVVPVPRDRLDDYLKLAQQAGAIWKEYGALEYVESLADDVPEGEHTSFSLSVKLQPGEIVVFSWIVYAGKEDRDRILAQVMADPRLKSDPENMPFDGKRMFWGGFREAVRL